MPLIRPFAALRPAPEYAGAVLAPPYDVLDTSEARQKADHRAWSFLHVSRAEIDLPEGTDPYDPAVYARSAENFGEMLAEDVLMQDDAVCYYVYRLVMGSHVQIGIAAVASLAAYEAGRIKRHEFTRPVKEDDRVRQIEALGAQTGPVFLVYRADAPLDAILAEVAYGSPDMDVTADDGVRHSLWLVYDTAHIEAISAAFEGMQALYVADGHHRLAAAARVAAVRSAANPGHHGDEAYNYFLSVMFPHDQMHILDYNRVVRDLNGMHPEALLAKVAESFDVKLSVRAVHPGKAGSFGMYLNGAWYRLAIHDELVEHDDVTGRLDASLLQDHLLAPLLGIGDPRKDERIDFVGGVRGLKELERRVDTGEMAVAFSLFPTSMQDLMAVADAGEVMPPKSTWFEPKLADGLLTHLID